MIKLTLVVVFSICLLANLSLQQEETTSEPSSNPGSNHKPKPNKGSTTVNSEKCGERPSEVTRIIGGKIAGPNDWPWQIVLKSNGEFICGGSLINNQWILTASHCIDASNDVNTYSIQLGVHDLTEPEDWAVEITAEQIFVNPGWDDNRLINDITLIKLQEAVTFSDHIKPICLVNSSYTFTYGELAWATGFGLTKGFGQPSDDLMQVQLPLLTEDKCQEYANSMNGSISYEFQICAGQPHTNTSACQGDSGGPLSWKDKNSGKYVLAGITSWGAMDCSGGVVYNRPAAYFDWILQTIQSN